MKAIPEKSIRPTLYISYFNYVQRTKENYASIIKRKVEKQCLIKEMGRKKPHRSRFNNKENKSNSGVEKYK